MIIKKYWCSWVRSVAPVFSGLGIKVAFWSYKARIHKNIKVCFQTLEIVWGDFCPHSPIPGKILILLDTHNLSECQILPKLEIATFAICHCHLPFLASLDMAIFDVQTSYQILRTKITSDNYYGLKTNFNVFVKSCLITLEGNLNS